MAFLSGTAAAAGIALIAAVGNLGGFVGPAFTGIAEDQTGSYEMPLVVLAGMLVVCSLLVLRFARSDPSPRRRRRERRGPVSAGQSARAGCTCPGSPLLLVNAWDPPSARRLAHDGYPAIATTSAGVAEALGYEDGNVTPPDEMLAAVGRIAAVVDVPVTADLEAGYGLTPSELVDGLLCAGAVGLNFEDTDHEGGGMVDAESQAERLAAIKEAGRAAGVDVVLNARVDAFLHDGELDEAVRRGSALRRGGRRLRLSDRRARAGRDPPARRGDRRAGERAGRCREASTSSELAELGVARASFGSGLMHIAMDAAAEQASEYRATGPG